MGSAEDRATLREQERLEAASHTAEMLIPGYGIWTVSGVKELLDDRERREAERLQDQDPGRFASWASPARMRREKERERIEEEDRR